MTFLSNIFVPTPQHPKHGWCHQEMVTHQKSLVIVPVFGDYLNQIEPSVLSIPKIVDNFPPPLYRLLCYTYCIFFNTHLGYSFYFTVVCLCHITRGIPPPNGGIVGKNRVSGVFDWSLHQYCFVWLLIRLCHDCFSLIWLGIKDPKSMWNVSSMK